jgi:predicted ATP-grasp superfamily ATP-dependent carboligase
MDGQIMGLLQSGPGPLILDVNSSSSLEKIEKAIGRNLADKIMACMERNINKKTKLTNA